MTSGKKLIGILALGCIFTICSADSCVGPTCSTTEQNAQQEQINAEGNMAVGMPNIKNFREKRLLKEIYELRDQDGLVTYTYLTDLNGHLHFFCNSIGYGIPYATQYTSPERPARSYETSEQGNITIPQEDPNGLFSPADAEGTWVMCKDPNSTNIAPIYTEPRDYSITV